MRLTTSLRKRLGKLKRGLIRHGDLAILYMRWAGRVLGSAYPGLVLDMTLEDKFAQGPFPSLRYVKTDRTTQTIAIDGISINWPRAHPVTGIGWVYREVFAMPQVNPHAYEYRQVRMTPGTWVIDAGASEGFFVHYALMRGCNVLAIEPDPAFVGALRLTFGREIANGRVKVIAGAVGDSPGMTLLRLDAVDVFSSSVAADGSIPVRVYTIDELVSIERLYPLSFIKMDIEGAEVHVFEGARSVLRDQKPDLSVAVYHTEAAGTDLKEQIRRIAPEYRVRFRGVWLRNDDPPRPYMLMAHARRDSQV